MSEMSENNSKPKEEKTENNLSEKQINFFIQLIDLKEDNNMTRIYSAITNSNSLNPNNN